MAIPNDSQKNVLTPNAHRGWYKWIDGKSRYICSSKLSADEALRYWYQNEKAIRARFKPKITIRPDAYTVHDLVMRYYDERKIDHANGTIGDDQISSIGRSLRHVLQTIDGKRLAESLRPDDFNALANVLAKFGQSQQRGRALNIMAMFKHAASEEWIARVPNFGKRLKAISETKSEVLPKHIWTAEECRAILAAIEAKAESHKKLRSDLVGSYRQLYALTLLGLNGGFGMKELAALKVSNVRGDMIESIRAKTKVQHRVPLWPETLAAMQPWLKDRKPGDLLFRTHRGHALTRTKMKGRKVVTVDGPGATFAKVVKEIGLKRSGHGFYLLKHTHRSASGGAGDESAADILVGHRLPAMRAVYQQVSVDRIRKVSEHIRSWLFSQPTTLPHDRESKTAAAAST